VACWFPDRLNCERIHLQFLYWIIKMNRAPLIEFIRKTVPLSFEISEAIAENFQEKHFKPGQKFLNQDKVSDEYLFLQEGFMRSFLYDTAGDEVTLNFFPRNSVVFEVASFFQRIPSQENIEALAECSGWILNYEQLNGLFHRLPEFREFGRAVLVKGFISFKERTFSMINKTAEERYAALISTRPEIFQMAPLKYIASYLGVTDSSLSRIRREYVKK
jgi:CRP-like cAMP-binding protein